MSSDIVARLREEGFITHMAQLPRESKILHSAADEIERLRNNLDGAQLAYRGASYDRDRMRAERDEARRSVCEMSIELGGVFRRVGGKTVEVTTPEGCAEIMRWDCFKEASDER
jgi:hypothetical protein